MVIHLLTHYTLLTYTLDTRDPIGSKKLWRGQEDKRKPRTSELFDSETLKQFSVGSF